MELNPNHPAAQAMHDQWHKMFVTLMIKLKMNHVLITMDDVRKAVDDPNNCITVQELDDGIHFRLISREDAVELAKKEGGLPS